MRLSFLFSFFLLFSLPAADAQVRRTLYYPEGNKLFEGAMLFTGAGRMHTETLDLILEKGAEQLAVSNLMERGVLTRYPLDQLFVGVQLNGNCRLYYKKSKLMISQDFNQGIPNGPYEEYFPGGGKAISCSYKDGMLNGTCVHYGRKGSPIFEGKFEAYTQEEIATIFQSGKPTVAPSHDLTGTFASIFSTYQLLLESAQAKLNGRYLYYFEDGKKEAVLEYKNSVRHGIWELWNWSGQLTNKVEFKEGVLVYVYDDNGKKYTIEAYKELLDLMEKEKESKPVEQIGK